MVEQWSMQPIDTTPRQRVLDVLRGTAVLGTVLTNVWIFAWLAYVGPPPPLPSEVPTLADPGGVAASPPPREAIDLLAQTMAIFANGKFLGMLAVALGIGLQLSQMRSAERGRSWLDGALRRYGVLLLLGSAHCLLVFQWDILVTYAMAALVAVFVVRCGPRVMLVTTLGAGAVALVWLGGWLSLGSLADWAIAEQWQGLARRYADTTYLHQLDERWHDTWKHLRTAVTQVPEALLLILIGAWLARAGVVATPSRRPDIRWALAVAGLCIALPLTAAISFNVLDHLYPWLEGSYAAQPHSLPTTFGYIAERSLLGPLVALGYISLISIALERGWSGWIVDRLAEVGRVPLTGYVLQNVLTSSVFLSWGLGLRPTASGLGMLGVIVAVWGVLLGVGWLAAQRVKAGGSGLGPLEWLWRLMAGLPGHPQR